MMTTAEILKNAENAKSNIASADTFFKNLALTRASEFLIRDTQKILSANKIDIENARNGVSEVMLDRLTLNENRIKAMANAILDVVKLPDPIGNVINKVKRPNGLEISKVTVPIGVIAIIFESRPNVTSDAAALCLKSGNVCVLRGGKEAINSNTAIAQSFRDALKDVGLDENAVNLITDTTRNSSVELMQAVGLVDLLIPRGGAGLIRACVENAKVPCIQTGTGICHIYVDGKADIDMALDIVENAKVSRPSVCNAAEVCLVDKSIADEFLPKLYDRLVNKRKNENKIPVELRLDDISSKIISGKSAENDDFDTEFLNFILAIKIVDGVNEAVNHIRKHSTGHSEAIITKDQSTADFFTSLVDSSSVYVNASTRFTDGGEFGLGCEIGISTQKMHARGPMGLMEMTSYKYIIRGNGQIR